MQAPARPAANAGGASRLSSASPFGMMVDSYTQTEAPTIKQVRLSGLAGRVATRSPLPPWIAREVERKTDGEHHPPPRAEAARVLPHRGAGAIGLARRSER
jgi:hypothetical protein